MNRYRPFRIIAFLEGVSYISLLGIAMPLKYIWGVPEAVKIVGWAHGVLFILYVGIGAITAYRARWPIFFSIWAFVASLIPFGTFVLEWQLRNEEAPESP